MFFASIFSASFKVSDFAAIICSFASTFSGLIFFRALPPLTLYISLQRSTLLSSEKSSLSNLLTILLPFILFVSRSWTLLSVLPVLGKPARCPTTTSSPNALYSAHYSSNFVGKTCVCVVDPIRILLDYLGLSSSAVHAT